MKSLVIILGAGASKEVNLPVGVELKDDIARLLDFRLDSFGRQQSGDSHIVDALRLIESKFKANREAIDSIRASRRIRDAMPQAISIDNFIDCHAGDTGIAVCGKLAIARSILAAEGKSSLNISKGNIYNKLNFAGTTKTWLNGFFQILTENCRVEDLPSRLQRVGVVSFNYDRCFEHYLFHAIQNYHGIGPERAAEILSNLDVHHPYGMVGKLPWMSVEQPVEFGADVDVRQLVAIAEQLRTFTEGTDPGASHIEEIRSTVRQGSRLVFMGFAFHRLNMELLFGPLDSAVEQPPQSIYGTALGISHSDCEVIKDELAMHINPNEQTRVLELRQLPIWLRNDLACAGLVQEYRRSLSLA